MVQASSVFAAEDLAPGQSVVATFTSVSLDAAYERPNPGYTSGDPPGNRVSVVGSTLNSLHSLEIFATLFSNASTAPEFDYTIDLYINGVLHDTASYVGDGVVPFPQVATIGPYNTTERWLNWVAHVVVTNNHPVYDLHHPEVSLSLRRIAAGGGTINTPFISTQAEEFGGGIRDVATLTSSEPFAGGSTLQFDVYPASVFCDCDGAVLNSETINITTPGIYTSSVYLPGVDGRFLWVVNAEIATNVNMGIGCFDYDLDECIEYVIPRYPGIGKILQSTGVQVSFTRTDI